MTKKNSNDEHAKYGPSSTKNRAICPGWENIPGSNPASEEGDRLHAFCEHDGDETKAAADYTKRRNKPWVELTDEQRDWANSALAYVAQLPRLGEQRREVRIPLHGLGMKGTDFGTADLLQFETAERVHLVDYKFGWGSIDPVEQNYQFTIYVLGVMLMHPSVMEVVTHMVQPKHNIVDCHTFRREEFDALLAKCQAVHAKVLRFVETRDISLLNPDPQNCEYCRNQAQCPKWQSTALMVAQEAASTPLELVIDPLMIPAQIAGGWEIETADPVRVAQFMAIVPALEKFLTKFKAYALEVHRTKGEVPGFAEVESPGRSEVLSPLDTLDIIAERFGIERDEVVGAFRPSLTELKALVSSKAPRGEKGRAGEAVVDALSDAGLIVRNPGYSYLKKQKTKKLTN